MEAAAARVRAQRAQLTQPRQKPLTSEKLQACYHRANRRRPIRRPRAPRTIINDVLTLQRWKLFASHFEDPKGRDWKELVRALSWDERGLVEAYGKWAMERAGARIKSESAVRRYFRNLSALYFRFKGEHLDLRLRDHMLTVVRSEITPNYGLRTEPKRKNILGPRAFTYLVHFAWVRWRRPFKIGLDRSDHVLCEMLEEWTGCRRHELVYASQDIDTYMRQYDEESDAFTDVEDASDNDVMKQPKKCWTCSELDGRTHPQYQVICWEDVTLGILRDPFDTGRDVFTMDIMLRFHKNHNKETRPTKFHFEEEEYPLLCPIAILISKAAAEGAIDFTKLGIDVSEKSMEDIICALYNTKLHRPSVTIPWKKEFWHRPVFRKTAFTAEGKPVKTDQPVTAAMHDNNLRNHGKDAGLPDNLKSYDFRRGNLDTLETNFNPATRNRGARHRPGTTVFETFYYGDGMKCITQNAFLGRGAHSPLLDIVNYIGVIYDENAPTEATEEMMRAVGYSELVVELDQELAALEAELRSKYGSIRLSTPAEREQHAKLQTRRRYARQTDRRRTGQLFRKDYFDTKNNEELSRQLQSETRPETSETLRQVYFSCPERRRIAALAGDFDSELTEAEKVQRKVDWTLALFHYAFVVEQKEPLEATYNDMTQPKLENAKPPHRPWFTSMIQDPAGPPVWAPEFSTMKNIPPKARKGPYECPFCRKRPKRRATMWNCADRHLSRMTAGILCPRSNCTSQGTSFESEMEFKNHMAADHQIYLRPIAGSYEVAFTHCEMTHDITVGESPTPVAHGDELLMDDITSEHAPPLIYPEPDSGTWASTFAVSNAKAESVGVADSRALLLPGPENDFTTEQLNSSLDEFTLPDQCYGWALPPTAEEVEMFDGGLQCLQDIGDNIIDPTLRDGMISGRQPGEAIVAEIWPGDSEPEPEPPSPAPESDPTFSGLPHRALEALTMDIDTHCQKAPEPGDGLWNVDSLVGRYSETCLLRGRERKEVKYRVRWEGCEDKDDTWEPKSELLRGGKEVRKMVKQFDIDYPLVEGDIDLTS
ncbi:hypothetical protein GQ53DRAFT_681814 [Thozetella sp. PMI_491]|nr:hypothetical protein GQ53DRAFT_681814 [Thozetella sp. PMI_491]